MDDSQTIAKTTTAGPALDRETVSERVVAAVADATDTAPENLTPPLFSAVDPEALEAFVRSLDGESADPGGRVEFSYCGCEVTVTADGRVHLVGDGDEA